MEINKNETYKLVLDDLSVASFEPQPDPLVAAAIDPNGRAWTGCLSDCTECGSGAILL